MKNLRLLFIAFLAMAFTSSGNVNAQNTCSCNCSRANITVGQNDLFPQLSCYWYESQFTRTTGNFMNITQCEYNVLIGKAVNYITTESYCVIVGSKQAAKSLKGKNMAWSVDWNDSYLANNPKVKAVLLNYYNDYIKTGKDNKQYRRLLAMRIIDITQSNQIIYYNKNI